MSDGSLRLWLARRLIQRMVAQAGRRSLAIRGLRDTEGRESRWLTPEIEVFVAAMTAEAIRLRPHAHQAELPTFGSQLMVEIAIWTMAADRSLRACAIAPETHGRWSPISAGISTGGCWRSARCPCACSPAVHRKRKGNALAAAVLME